MGLTSDTSSLYEHLGVLTPPGWRDYELVTTGDGMKKERWGSWLLLRPDPQVIWPVDAGGWGRLDAKYLRSRDGGGSWSFHSKLPDSWTVSWRDRSFQIRPTQFKHTGLFPEQAVNWDWLEQTIRHHGKPCRVLNLFGYTGGATLAAAAAGAQVVHVDASKGMVQWCRDNATLSNLQNASIRYLVEDCVKFVERENRRGSRYEGILLDPPSFGRGNKGEVWQLERDLFPLLLNCRRVLSDAPLFFLLNAYTTGLSSSVLGNLLQLALGVPAEGIQVGELGLVPSEPGPVLPCGTFARWRAND